MYYTYHTTVTIDTVITHRKKIVNQVIQHLGSTGINTSSGDLEIQTVIALWLIFPNSFVFYEVFVGFFEYNFYDIREIGSFKSPSNNRKSNKGYDVIIYVHEFISKFL